ncbi:Reverse transcriptase zinc-binding domain [Macleaya cordata]|uniref:Reverse transcriptase zinc-binding domain n=1 Tax=Macleaya cordata TaxID=56857 RepID=A0A200PLQ9_MACCD|nr:Reverse transcriptase zinc-binding domain [Macleaya cordata]
MAPIAEVFMDGNGLDFSFSRVVNDDERRSLIQLVHMLDQVPPLNVEDDEIHCKFALANRFSAKECYNISMREVGDIWDEKLLWRKEIPSKISFMVWCALRNAMPTIDNLIRRGMTWVNKCYLCNRSEETVLHLLLHCPITAAVWNYFIKVAGMQWVQSNEIIGVIQSWERCTLRRRAKKIWKLIPFAIWWSVWLGRNDCAFNSNEITLPDLICKAKSFMFFWGLRGDIFNGYSFFDLLNGWEALMAV